VKQRVLPDGYSDQRAGLALLHQPETAVRQRPAPSLTTSPRRSASRTWSGGFQRTENHLRAAWGQENRQLIEGKERRWPRTRDRAV